MSATTDLDIRNFHQWIRAPIRKLLSTRHAGFALAMIAFPVLERWIRGKVGIGSRPLRGRANDRFCTELAVQFQSLRDPADGSFPHVAHAFWQAFRNGILHQTTFSRMPIKVFGAEAETAQIISDMIRQHCKSSKELHTRLLIDQLARAVSRKMRLKMAIEIEDVVGNKKQIPAPDNERYELIRQLILRRVGADSIGGPIDELPIELLLSTADSAVLLIVEQYYVLREQGMTDELAI